MDQPPKCQPSLPCSSPEGERPPGGCECPLTAMICISYKFISSPLSGSPQKSKCCVTRFGFEAIHIMTTRNQVGMYHNKFSQID